MSPCLVLSLVSSTAGSDDSRSLLVVAALVFTVGYVLSWLFGRHAHSAGWLEGYQAARVDATHAAVEKHDTTPGLESWNGANAASAARCTRRPPAPVVAISRMRRKTSDTAND